MVNELLSAKEEEKDVENATIMEHELTLPHLSVNPPKSTNHTSKVNSTAPFIQLSPIALKKELEARLSPIIPEKTSNAISPRVEESAKSNEEAMEDNKSDTGNQKGANSEIYRQIMNTEEVMNPLYEINIADDVAEKEDIKDSLARSLNNETPLSIDVTTKKKTIEQMLRSTQLSPDKEWMSEESISPTADTGVTKHDLVKSIQEPARKNLSTKMKSHVVEQLAVDTKQFLSKKVDTDQKIQHDTITGNNEKNQSDKLHQNQASIQAQPTQTHHKQNVTGYINWQDLFNYCKGELCSVEVDGPQDLKRERVINFLHVPAQIEKLMFFGYLICLDSFLYIFTILPIRIMIALIAIALNIIPLKDGKALRSSQKCDIFKGILIILCCIALHYMDASRLYHSVRGQAILKLYVIFNALEILDRLCCSFGQDVLDSFFAAATDINTVKYDTFKPLSQFFLAFIYVFVHSLVLFYQTVTLNVAINSHNNALLTLLMSNQFVEIKGNVFKKFEKENLFQMSCSDIVERFQLSIFLFIATFRNLLELSPNFTISSLTYFIPFPQYWDTSIFSSLPGLSMHHMLDHVVYPVLLVWGSEVIVDWLKHAFITKFNDIRPSIYGRFIDLLCRDLSHRRLHEKGSMDQAPVVSRRLGFAAIPFACLFVRNINQILQMIGFKWSWSSLIALLFVYVIISMFKLLLGLSLLQFSIQRYENMKHIYTRQSHQGPMNDNKAPSKKTSSVKPPIAETQIKSENVVNHKDNSSQNQGIALSSPKSSAISQLNAPVNTPVFSFPARSFQRSFSIIPNTKHVSPTAPPSSPMSITRRSSLNQSFEIEQMGLLSAKYQNENSKQLLSDISNTVKQPSTQKSVSTGIGDEIHMMARPSPQFMDYENDDSVVTNTQSRKTLENVERYSLVRSRIP